jgi:ubiquinone/menaquinone biosynthesis C-methylase UbiE
MAVTQGVDLLPSILHRMRCPRCFADLGIDGEHLACGGCHARFPFREGIPLLAIQGTSETWTQRTAEDTSEEYQRAYQEVGEARKYNEAYRDRRTKRWSTRREYRLLERLLSSQPRAQVLLDLPSGGGRLSPQLSRYADLLVEADIGLGQLLYGKGSHKGDDPRIWMTASAFHIPFRDEAVDGVVCCRLSHHLPTPEERERLVSELLRVAKRFVIMTFFDHHSVKNWVRRARAPLDGQPPKMTMTIQRVRELSRVRGAELVAYPPLSRLFSGHRYALMVKA